MQSTNEEMQSVNEELHTINADYQLKNKELLEINDDLNNYFRSNINGQLFIDNELRLMKFAALLQINPHPLMPPDDRFDSGYLARKQDNRCLQKMR
nr:hypothetical protein [Mucilaginibacter rubeus]